MEGNRALADFMPPSRALLRCAGINVWVSPTLISADKHGNSDVIERKGWRAAEMKDVSVMKPFSSRHSLKCPFTVLMRKRAGIDSYFISGHTCGISHLSVNTQVSLIPRGPQFSLPS